MTFLDSLQQNNNVAHTENGAISNKSTLNANLDFFSRAGAMRENVLEAVILFNKALIEDRDLAIKSLFYMRDVRGGQGERKIFRACLLTVSEEIRKEIIQHIPTYGRWDDLLILQTDEIVPTIKDQLQKDMKAMTKKQPISLLAKWLPSENTSSKNTVAKAKELIEALGLSAPQYRKILSGLRGYITLLEQKMSKNEWDGVDYEKLPSLAHKKHIGAFNRHSKERYAKYLEQVMSGEKKINTSTLFTYEVYDMVNKGQEAPANAMWANLPDYTNGKNALVVADVSGSMRGRPMSVSVSLALYFAERNEGPFKDAFMTFSATPQIQKVVGQTLTDKMRMIESTEWGYNTDIEEVFRTLLRTAVETKATQGELPSILYIISDMEFDSCVSGDKTNYQTVKKAFEHYGYKLPHVVFWNVNARNNQSPATKFDKSVTLISGNSQSTFQYAIEGKTPIEAMESVLNSDRYAPIVLSPRK